MIKNKRKMFFCSGLKRSGSTWSYNVSRILLTKAYGKERVFSGYIGEGEAVESFVETHPCTQDILLLKFHYPTPKLVDLVVSRQARNVFTFRHPLNALASEIEFFNLPFEHALQNILYGFKSMDIWRENPGTIFIYFDDFMSRPATEIGRIIKHFDLQVTSKEVESCVEETSFNRTRDSSKEMSAWPEDKLKHVGNMKYDPVTLLHVGHASRGAQRHWRDVLAEDEIANAIKHLGPWLPDNISLNENDPPIDADIH